MQHESNVMDEKMEPGAYLQRLNAVRIITALALAFGYASTMPVGPDKIESLTFLGVQPSIAAIQILFFFSGFLALKSLDKNHNKWNFVKSRLKSTTLPLLIVTFCVVVFIYPIMCQTEESSLSTSIQLGKYFLLTVLCISPGVPLPGLLDDALYTSLIQGAIWTFRYGVLLYIFVIIGDFLKAFKYRFLILLAAALAVLFHIIGNYLSTQRSISIFPPALLVLSFSYPFLIGMTVWAYREMMPRTLIANILILSAFLGFGTISYFYMEWKLLSQIAVYGFWTYLAWVTMMSSSIKLSWLNNWPNFVIGIYIINWPVSQILFATFPELDRWTLPLVNLPVTLLLSYGLHKLLLIALKTLARLKLGRKVSA
ncbi:MAG: acyltransferase family protein [Maricaulaceae bacterium]